MGLRILQHNVRGNVLFYSYCFCPEARPALNEKKIQCGTNKRQMDAFRKQYIEENGFTVVQMWECEWLKLYESDVSVKEYLRESFKYTRALREDLLLDKIMSSALFGYVQCNIKVPQHLREQPPIFRQLSKTQTYADNTFVHQCKINAQIERLKSTRTKFCF